MTQIRTVHSYVSRTELNRNLSRSRGLISMIMATLGLVIVGIIFAPASLSAGVIRSTIPYVVVLAIVGLGQMLVVQQGGFDLSVPGSVSLSIVVVSHMPDRQDALVPLAIGTVLLASVVTGILNGFLIGMLGVNPIIVTLGVNSLLLGLVLQVSGGASKETAPGLRTAVAGFTLGIPNAIFFLIGIVLVVTLVLKKTPAGRRFEVIGASPRAAEVMALPVRLGTSTAYVWAQLLYAIAGILLAGITVSPSAYQGTEYLLTSVAVVVLGGTSLLGGRGFPFATIAAALFLTQLGQLVLAMGVPTSVRTVIQAVALAIGIALYTIDWSFVRRGNARGALVP